MVGQTHLATLCCCLWGRVREGTMLLAWPGWLSVTSPATHNQIGPFWCWFLGGWASLHSGPCGSLQWTNSPVRLGVSPTAETPIGFYSQRFWGFIFLGWNPGLHSLSRSPVVHPSLSTRKCGAAGPSAAALPGVFSTFTSPLHPSCCPGWMFLLYHLGCQTSIQFNFVAVWLFFVFKFFVVLLLVVQGGKVYLPLLPCWPEAHYPDF